MLIPDVFIRKRHESGTVDPDVEWKIKQVVYFRKLKAIKELVHLLSLRQQDVNLPPKVPQDLIDLIFSTDNLDQIENLELLSQAQLQKTDGVALPGIRNSMANKNVCFTFVKLLLCEVH